MRIAEVPVQKQTDNQKLLSQKQKEDLSVGAQTGVILNLIRQLLHCCIGTITITAVTTNLASKYAL